MSEYKEIKGIKVQELGADPPAPFDGQVWYNNSSGDLKYLSILPSGWATAANLPVGAEQVGGAGTQTAGLSMGGYAVPGFLNTSSEYDGSVWTAGGTMSYTRFAHKGTGLQTAALAIGGYSPTAAVEEYDGSTWTAGGALNFGRRASSSCGTQTAALAFGGDPTAGPEGTSTEEYDGSTWTAGGNLALSRRYMAACGTQTAGLGAGGKIDTDPGTASTEEYDGTTWTAGGALNAAVKYAQGCGTQTAGFIFGGVVNNLPVFDSTGAGELYNGTSWTTSPSSLNVARQRHASATSGTQTSALSFGGLDTSNVKSNSTEEFSEGGPATFIIGTD